MKKGLKITKALFILFILVSTVSLLPVVNAEVTTPDRALSKLRIIKNKLIEKLGEERYREIEENVSEIIDNHFLRINCTGYDLPLLDLLKEIATILVAIMVLLFGNNPVGVGFGILLCTILLSIPMLIVATVVTAYDLSQIGSEELDLERLIEEIGLIGTFIFCIFIIPVLIIALSLALIIVIPITWATLMQELIWYATPPAGEL